MTFEIDRDGKAIKCLLCGMVSLAAEDVEGRRCPRCRVSHEEYDRNGWDASRPKRDFEEGETVERGGRRYVVVVNKGTMGRVRDENGRELFPFFWFSEGEWCARVEER